MVCAALYMATLAVTQRNPVIAASSWGREDEKIALTTCIRKLLTILNAMSKHNCPWDSVLNVRNV